MITSGMRGREPTSDRSRIADELAPPRIISGEIKYGVPCACVCVCVRVGVDGVVVG